jgi:hypothetical protein
MINEETLVGVFAAVLTGVLVFLTIETSFRSVRNAEVKIKPYPYADLKTEEGKVTLGMIVLLSTSILIMILTSTLMPVAQPNANIVSSIIFTAAIILLIWRVYLHGK